MGCEFVHQLIFSVNIEVGLKHRKRILRGNPGTDPTIVSLLLKPVTGKTMFTQWGTYY
jgi:hypothetical protein